VAPYITVVTQLVATLSVGEVCICISRAAVDCSLSIIRLLPLSRGITDKPAEGTPAASIYMQP